MMLYFWLKAFHVISIIAWMSALLYLPRLMVYHVGSEPGSVQSETFKVMERRLLRVIANPAMIAAWIFGLWLAYVSQAWTMPWFHAKVTLVLLLTIAHMAMARWVRKFGTDSNTHSARFYRIMNEVPTVLMIGIVIIVFVKPF
ncbi:protoporphyrinogen oxidase HemJ [Acuticoccus sp. M5D2P5]|uniref:protoporphyrinogen oxidase HemJ n=1 Tax=Acuticoccus kalidii TaxID=2910977 RepID=UPI001F3C1BEE|nr:protoporphyrinogen oxidase HemJ [Acuticoccus kalidii]MCF3933980.1 protoporphyrinogen oxidase HemJ [Acuticoccus kalidii]